ncbi:B3/4 domain-containing protein [Secundilactobacillus oryzae JCM 18671]|uniref:B3/4 domain-containing protein n=1 Tax=Secundilactobacillus oryzae JCM 18671 TaxID=1291743 RepID=A0A081BJQ5_9LACO|nr:phenylalanine--tRNA ligase beta subunit-related protein [Secundilactobacillus oryzae]GAK48273.1 B3/4 domain-containing protein [Secundilactobacillus oryzae JCM 18671]
MAKKVIIDPEFWDLFPEANIDIVFAKGIDNHVDESKDPHFQQILSAAEAETEPYIEVEPFRNNPVIAEWRDAFTKFKTKKGARSSIEALLKRVSQGHQFTPINPLVDIYNSISLKFAVPAGGETIAKIDGDLHLGVAKGGEGFRPLGAEEDAPALEGEVIYYDNTGAVCRCFNWREAQRTMLTEETTEAVLVVESINENQAARAKEGIAELKQLIDSEFGATTEIVHLSKDNQQAEWPY